MLGDDVVAFARRRLGFHPDAQQEEVLRQPLPDDRGSEGAGARHMLNCSRQWGKSTVAAVMAVHRAYFRPKSVVVVACPTEKQSAELVWKAREFTDLLGIKRKTDGNHRISLMFPNGSRIVGIPGNEKTLRSLSAVSLLIIDEAARVDDSTYKALRPMLAVSNGDLWLLSTPFGKRGFFYENWSSGSEEWVRTKAPATECVRISARFLEEERRQMGDAWFRQEYLCEFMDADAQMFGRDLLERALVDGEGLRFLAGG